MSDKSFAKGKPVVVVAEPLAQSGLDVLRDGGLEVCEAGGREELETLVAGAHALIVRSKTKVTGALLDAAPSLQVVGRAGVGVDTIDVDAATRAGIVVLNTPDASTLATAEHTMTLMLALCRHVAAGQTRIKERRWSAQGLMGVELAGKTLGVIGLGRIGAAVAARGRGFAMTVLGHDAVVSEARAESLGVKLVPLDELLARSDFVTLHTPLTPQTQGLVGERELALMKTGARILNCARGGLIDESALLAALESGHIAGAALDVIADEPPKHDSPIWTLLDHPHVVATPHLGGSTREAQERIAADLCRDVVAVLRGRPPSGAVNAPVKAPPEVRPFVELAYRLGTAFPQVADAESLSHFDIALEGDLASYDGLPFTVSFLVGLLPHLTDERVSAVNAQDIARRMGMTVETLGGPCERGFAKALAVRGQRSSLAGTIVHGEKLRLVDIDGFEIDVLPQGHLLLTRHHDVPGIVGKVGTILGKAQINISTMQVARSERGDAIMLLGIDRAPDAPILKKLREIEDVERVQSIEL
ncbi:MAG TPA: phosphoglycerate dehydrogenase [Candidatus Eremiobacteraceae bacterium]|nr:phosphoglycerate dehydrogenase [Candidatus Eremiobacteraceae bacterium]